jgi:hypothetical protein
MLFLICIDTAVVGAWVSEFRILWAMLIDDRDL